MSFDGHLSETMERLQRLERWEWWRWGTVCLISMALMIGLFSESYPVFRQDILSLNQLQRLLWGLLGMVLLFDIFAFYQQMKISRLRRELASQIGMLSTLEALRPPNTVEEIQKHNRRKCTRFLLDQRLKVVLPGNKAVHGRTRDISEGGLGAVIADPLDPGTRVELEFPVGIQDLPLRLSAVVCFRRGFHHGFEFLVPSSNDLAVIRKVCSQANLVS
jgi:hypothetical protein